MTQRRWSLARRLTLWFVLGTGVLVFGVAALSVVYLHRTVDAELDAITENRLKELRVRFQAYDEAERTAQTFERLALQIASEGEHRLAWRVWSVGFGWIEHENGATELLTPDYPKQAPKGVTRRLPGGARWRTESFQDGTDVGLVLDGSAQIALLRRYEIFSGLLVGAGVLLSLLGGTLLLRRASKTLRDIADSARRVRDPDAPLDVDVSNAPDEIREVVDALHELLRNINTASEHHRVLYASMAHELRAPIQNLVGSTEVALLSRREAEAYRKVLDSHLEELRELGDAIDNLMTICAPRASSTAAHVVERFDVAEEARLRLRREAARAERAGIAFELRTTGDGRFDGDREGVMRAVRNLAANAIEWSPKGGTVAVDVACDDAHVVVTVDDSGPGVPLDQREKIFDPFYRGPSAQGRRIGYGLGLAMVKEAADRHAGAIEVDTSPAGGARFRLTLPKRR